MLIKTKMTLNKQQYDTKYGFIALVNSFFPYKAD